MTMTAQPEIVPRRGSIKLGKGSPFLRTFDGFILCRPDGGLDRELMQELIELGCSQGHDWASMADDLRVLREIPVEIADPESALRAVSSLPPGTSRPILSHVLEVQVLGREYQVRTASETAFASLLDQLRFAATLDRSRIQLLLVAAQVPMSREDGTRTLLMLPQIWFRIASSSH